MKCLRKACAIINLISTQTACFLFWVTLLFLLFVMLFFSLTQLSQHAMVTVLLCILHKLINNNYLCNEVTTTNTWDITSLCTSGKLSSSTAPVLKALDGSKSDSGFLQMSFRAVAKQRVFVTGNRNGDSITPAEKKENIDGRKEVSV